MTNELRESSISSVGPEVASTHQERIRQSNTQPWSRKLWNKQMQRPRAWLSWPLFITALVLLLGIIVWSGLSIEQIKGQAGLCKDYAKIRESKNITDNDLIRYHRTPGLSPLSGKDFVLDEVENVPCPVWNRRVLVYGNVLIASSVHCFFVLMIFILLLDRRIIRFEGRRQPIDDIKNPTPGGLELVDLGPRNKENEPVLINMPPPAPIEGMILGNNSSRRIRDWLEERAGDLIATANNLALENRGSVDWHSLPRSTQNPTISCQQNSMDNWPLPNSPLTQAGPSGTQSKGKAKSMKPNAPSRPASEPQPRWKPGYMITDYDELLTSTISRILHDRQARIPKPPTREALIAKLHELDRLQSRLANMGPLGPPLEETRDGKKAPNAPLWIACGTESVELDGVEVQVAQVGRMYQSEASQLKQLKMSLKKEGKRRLKRDAEAAELNETEAKVGQATTKPSGHYTWPRMPRIILEEMPVSGDIGTRGTFDDWKRMRESDDAKGSRTSPVKEGEGGIPLVKVESWDPGDDGCLDRPEPSGEKKDRETGKGEEKKNNQDGPADSGEGRGEEGDGQVGSGKENGQVGNGKENDQVGNGKGKGKQLE